MTNSRFISSAIVGAIVSLSLTACTISSFTVSEAVPVEQVEQCAVLLTESAAESLDESGSELSSSWPADVPALPQSVYHVLFVRNGGVTCQWTDPEGATILYSALEADTAQQDDARRFLTEAGFGSYETTSGKTVFEDPEADPRFGERFAVTEHGVFGVAGGGRFEDIASFEE